MTYVLSASFPIVKKEIEDHLGATNKLYLILHKVDSLHSDRSTREKAGGVSRMQS